MLLHNATSVYIVYDKAYLKVCIKCHLNSIYRTKQHRCKDMQPFYMPFNDDLSYITCFMKQRRTHCYGTGDRNNYLYVVIPTRFPTEISLPTVSTSLFRWLCYEMFQLDLLGSLLNRNTRKQVIICYGIVLV